ncbi:Rieske (2Fe-2S) protein [Mycolicibacterium vanbaalenii]|uniref:Rieske (2Fe-2S) protein n=1 Tax=Mycolicibacterium vanbaalenii TaxID=110539 RepID=UPI0027E24976|nr:Rieske (2Fe-2S) protein [Mycolicibacterium vanbaalenii]
MVLTQPNTGEFKAFSAVCTHAGCTVSEVIGASITCPCHGSSFHLDGTVPRPGQASLGHHTHHRAGRLDHPRLTVAGRRPDVWISRPGRRRDRRRRCSWSRHRPYRRDRRPRRGHRLHRGRHYRRCPAR